MQTATRSGVQPGEVNRYRCPDCDRTMVQDSEASEPIWCGCDGDLTLPEFEETIPYSEYLAQAPLPDA